MTQSTYKLSLRRYFSCVTMTTTGFGLIKPQHWATHIAVLIHMLISTLYHIVIFGLGLSRYFNTNKHQSTTKWTHFQRLSADLDDERPRRSSSGSLKSQQSSQHFESKFTIQSEDSNKNTRSKQKKASMTTTSGSRYQHPIPPSILDPEDEGGTFISSPGLSSL